MIDITQPNMILMLNGVEVSRHRSAVEAIEAARSHGAGEYVLIRPDATIVVEGEPDPDPDPDPPSGERPEAISRSLNSLKMLNFDYWNGNSRYERFSRHITWKDDSVNVDFKCQELGGGGRQVLQGTSYELLIDGEPHTTAVVTSGDTEGRFVVDTTAILDGWHVLDMVPHGTETSIPFPVFVLRGDELPLQEWMPVWTGSRGHSSRFRLHWVPVAGEGLINPLAPRDFPAFGNLPSESRLHLETLTGTMAGWPHRKFVTEDGIYTTATRQWYTWADLVRKTPRLPLLDGPRGRNSLGYPTHISIGTGQQDDEPDSPLMGNLYVTDPWRLMRVSPSGEVTTLVGYRHTGTPDQWQSPQNLELVGDWSAIPESRRGFHEIWGFCWHPQTLTIDNDAPRIPSEGNRRPHHAAPVAFIADSENNRVCRVEFNAAAHGIPPTVTEFVQAKDCWDCVSWGDDKLIVSERGDHRIAQYDMNTGLLDRVILQGAALARIDSNRFVVRTGSMTAIRAEDVVLPEGLYVVDDWLYFGSAAMDQIKRVDLVTGVVETLKTFSAGFSAHNYFKISVSDGTAGPKGTIFKTDWEVGDFGGPAVYEPGESKDRLFGYNSRRLHRGKGSGFQSLGYSSAVASRNGRIVLGSSFDGLLSISKALPSDDAPDRSAFSRGRSLWRASGYNLKYGEHAQSRFGEPLPWGEHPDMDAFLRLCGAVEQ